MRTIDKILLLLKEQHKKQKDLTDYLNISKGVFTDWKSGKNNSYLKHIGKIAEYFDVSVDYLLGKEKSPTANSDETLMFALYGNDNKDVTPAMLEDIRNFAQYVREKERNKTNGTGKPI